MPTVLGCRATQRAAGHTGTVIYGCAEYIASRLPTIFVLENVKGLLSHDAGKTCSHVKRILRAMGNGVYDVRYAILNIEQHGIPHHRPRVYIVGRLLTLCS